MGGHRVATHEVAVGGGGGWVVGWVGGGGVRPRHVHAKGVRSVGVGPLPFASRVSYSINVLIECCVGVCSVCEYSIGMCCHRLMAPGS